MSDEEKQQLSDTIKDKFHKLKTEAESSADTAKHYFNDLKDKAGSLFKEHFPDVEQHFENFFKNDTGDNTAKSGSSSTTSA
jgi:chromosome segregation ATPase